MGKIQTGVAGLQQPYIGCSSFLRFSWPQRMFLKSFLSDLEAECVLDVGANGGQYGAELRLIGYAGHIISFEPDPQSFVKLIGRSNKDPKWHALNIALGRGAGQAEFNIMAASMFNSFRRPSNEEAGKFSEDNKVVKTNQVEIAQLADVLPDLRRHHYFNKVFLRMDTQEFGTTEPKIDICDLQEGCTQQSPFANCQIKRL